MYFLPLNEPESVAGVIHILRNGLDCTTCPLGAACARVNKSLCQSIARDFEQMMVHGTAPFVQNKGEVPRQTPYQDVIDCLTVAAAPMVSGNDSIPAPQVRDLQVGFPKEVPVPPQRPPLVEITDEAPRKLGIFTVIQGGKR